MSPSDSHEGFARPIPQATGRANEGYAGEGYADEGYVVDTRRKVSLSRGERSAQQSPPRAAPPPPPRQAPPPRQSAPQSGYAQRPPGTRQPTPPGAGYAPDPIRPARRRSTFRPRRAVTVVALLLLGWLAFMVFVPFNAWRSVERVPIRAAQSPAAGVGANYLLVGSDSREGLSDAEAAALGSDKETVGKRTDTIMLIHVTAGGGTSAVISIPRDSYVAIPGHGSNKINAAFAFGGAKLLTQTLEQATGIRIDGYLEIGFGGFAKVVDSLGGVEVCVPTAIKDTMTGLDLAPGCQPMDGRTSLMYVRTRYTDPRGDLGRAERQRAFLSAVVKKAVSPSTVFIPTRYTTFADAMSQGLTVSEGMSMFEAVGVLQALRSISNGEGVSLQVPVENPAYQTKNAGVAVKWNDAKAKDLFTSLREDRKLTS